MLPLVRHICRWGISQPLSTADSVERPVELEFRPGPRLLLHVIIAKLPAVGQR